MLLSKFLPAARLHFYPHFLSQRTYMYFVVTDAIYCLYFAHDVIDSCVSKVVVMYFIVSFILFKRLFLDIWLDRSEKKYKYL